LALVLSIVLLTIFWLLKAILKIHLICQQLPICSLVPLAVRMRDDSWLLIWLIWLASWLAGWLAG
jgi:hypothetical protein